MRCSRLDQVQIQIKSRSRSSLDKLQILLPTLTRHELVPLVAFKEQQKAWARLPEYTWFFSTAGICECPLQQKGGWTEDMSGKQTYKRHSAIRWNVGQPGQPVSFPPSQSHQLKWQLFCLQNLVQFAGRPRAKAQGGYMVLSVRDSSSLPTVPPSWTDKVGSWFQTLSRSLDLDFIQSNCTSSKLISKT